MMALENCWSLLADVAQTTLPHRRKPRHEDRHWNFSRFDRNCAVYSDDRLIRRRRVSVQLEQKMTEHKSIWLQPWCDECEASSEDRLWCQDDVWASCETCGAKPVKYLVATTKPARETQGMTVHPVERLWREVGLPEYFLGNGGTNTKLYALYDAIRAAQPEALTGCLHPGNEPKSCQYEGKCISHACDHYGKTERCPVMTVLAQVDGIVYPKVET
jgi:hypothetical protein